MIGAVRDWLDRRIGYRPYLKAMRNRTLPDGPSWFLTSASCLFALLLIQGFTGLLMMACYSPSMSSAWACVHYIDQTQAGAFLRGVHHYTSHAMIILFLIHMARVMALGAYRAPRELIWITGLILIPLIIVWTVTGNPLAGSQKGVAQIEVEANILGATPIVGPPLRKLLIGGDEVGNLTLTHLYFLHVGLLPLVVVLLTTIHMHQVIKHAMYLSDQGQDESSSAKFPYWPHQSFRNRFVLTVVVGIISWLAWKHGAPLDAPADPDLPQAPRPEWYFRWLFELRRYFTGDLEFIATIVLPTALLLFFIFLPLIDRWLKPRHALLFRAFLVCGGMAGWSWLTFVSINRDAQDKEYLATVMKAEALATRARELADRNQVSPAGAQHLLRSDPQTQGPLLYARHCASCHPHAEIAVHDGQDPPTAPDLTNFASTEWILGFLDPQRVASPQVYGGTKFKKGEMVRKIHSLYKEAGADGKQELDQDLRLIARALSAEAKLPGQKEADAKDQKEIAKGREALTEKLTCTECHKFQKEGDLGSAPDLTDYGSAAWLRGIIAQPNGERFYEGEKNDRMPSFAADMMHPEQNLLSPLELNMLVRWLRHDVQ